MNDKQCLTTIERTVLTQLENKCQELSNYLGSYSRHAFGQLTQVAALIQTLGQWEQTFLDFEPQAQHLDSHGLPQLTQRLGFVIRDLRNAIAICRQMYEKLLCPQGLSCWQS
jgi:hypothetical protein